VRGHAHIRWALALVALTLTLALAGSVAVGSAEVPAPSGCPPASSSSAPAPNAEQPTATALPAAAAILVCVGSRAITGAQFSHWLVIAQKGQGKGERPTSPADMSSEVLGFLISAHWVVGEAERLRIDVTPAQVERSFVHIRNQQFPKPKEFQAFLRSSGQTVGDLKFRVKLNLLSQRTTKRVLSGRHGAAKQQHALARFVRGFSSRWRARTYCAAEYLTVDCGHVLGAA
jgi:hypothetical protein